MSTIKNLSLARTEKMQGNIRRKTVTIAKSILFVSLHGKRLVYLQSKNKGTAHDNTNLHETHTEEWRVLFVTTKPFAVIFRSSWYTTISGLATESMYDPLIVRVIPPLYKIIMKAFLFKLSVWKNCFNKRRRKIYKTWFNSCCLKRQSYTAVMFYKHVCEIDRLQCNVNTIVVAINAFIPSGQNKIFTTLLQQWTAKMNFRFLFVDNSEKL